VSERTSRASILAAALWLAASPANAGDPLLKDPTAAPGLPVAGKHGEKAPALQLRSTSVSATSRSAVINDRIVTTGSRIYGATVISIEPGRVHLQRGSKQFVLRLPSPSVKRPVDGDAT